MAKRAYEKEQLQQLCAESTGYNEILIKTNRTRCGKNIATLKKYINEYNIDVSHFTGSTSPNKYTKTELTETTICTQCGKEKNTYNDYYWSNGKRRSVCKECVCANERERYKKRTQNIEEFKKTLVCRKCGETRFYLLDFHHRDPAQKDYTISNRTRTNLEDMLNEIDKCDPLCSNCHREWHYLSTHENIEYEKWLAQ